MKPKKKKLSDEAMKKINRKSVEFSAIEPDYEDCDEDEFSSHSEDTLHSNKQINKNLGEY